MTAAQPNSYRSYSRSFQGAVSVVGLAIFLISLYQVTLATLHSEWLLLALVTILLVSRVDINYLKTSSAITLSDTFIFVSVLLYGIPMSVVLAGVDAAVTSLLHRDRRHLTAVNSAVMSLSIFVAAHSTRFILGDWQTASADWLPLLTTTGFLAIFHFGLNTGLIGVAMALRSGSNFFTVWKESLLWTSLSYFVGAAAACLIIKLIVVVSFLAFIIAMPILCITYFTYKVYLDKVDASNRHAEEMADLHLRTIEALAIAIDAKDEVTHDHVRRVQVYSTGLARLFGLSDSEIEALKAGALLHDIGKLAVPDYILNKPGKLTPAEFEKTKVHTIVGAEILERVGFPYPVSPVVRHHHERWDGRGYPDGLRGDEIPITARILAVADCFDAVREERQYRRAMTREEALSLLRDSSGSLFDPNVVTAFLEHLDEFESEIRELGVQLQTFSPKEDYAYRRDMRVDTGPPAYERIRSAHREVITLYDIAQTIGKSLDLRDTFAVFSSRLQDIVGYTTCVLYLLKQDTTEIEAVHVAGRNMERLRGKRMTSGLGISGWVVANNHPMHNSDPHLDFDAMRVEIEEAYRTSTVVPMIKDGETIGALALYSAEVAAYQNDHLRLVEAVAKLSADAIANALHHGKTETSALTDSLTGIPNARALRYRFEEDADRALRHRDPFCVVMLDLDGFKSVNDHFGHQAGDTLLIELSQVLVGQLRSSDFIARYAGDEFVALLQVSADEAREMIHRIQLAIERQNFRSGGVPVTIGISAGFACYESDGSTLDELLIAADRNMYSNKVRRKEMRDSLPLTGDMKRFRVL